MRSRLIKALNNRFYVKFMQLEIGLLTQNIFQICNLLKKMAHNEHAQAYKEQIAMESIFKQIYNE